MNHRSAELAVCDRSKNQGKSSWFLPFNKWIGTTGAGNPPNPQPASSRNRLSMVRRFLTTTLWPQRTSSRINEPRYVAKKDPKRPVEKSQTRAAVSNPNKKALSSARTVVRKAAGNMPAKRIRARCQPVPEFKQFRRVGKIEISNRVALSSPADRPDGGWRARCSIRSLSK